MTDREPLDVDVVFSLPADVEARGFPALKGPGRASEEKGRLILRGPVFRLTAWWLKVFAPLGLLATAGLFVALEDVGLYLGLGGVIALVVADVLQRRYGRAYRLAIPRPCAYRLDVLGPRALLTLQLDQYVVGGGSRPPIVRLEVDSAHADRIERLIR